MKKSVENVVVVTRWWHLNYESIREGYDSNATTDDYLEIYLSERAP